MKLTHRESHVINWPSQGEKGRESEGEYSEIGCSIPGRLLKSTLINLGYGRRLWEQILSWVVMCSETWSMTMMGIVTDPHSLLLLLIRLLLNQLLLLLHGQFHDSERERRRERDGTLIMHHNRKQLFPSLIGSRINPWAVGGGSIFLIHITFNPSDLSVPFNPPFLSFLLFCSFSSIHVYLSALTRVCHLLQASLSLSLSPSLSLLYFLPSARQTHVIRHKSSTYLWIFAAESHEVRVGV